MRIDGREFLQRFARRELAQLRFSWVFGRECSPKSARSTTTEGISVTLTEFGWGVDWGWTERSIPRRSRNISPEALSASVPEYSL